MPTYKLYYFEARGAAELSRLVFAAAGKEYTDVRYSSEEWPKHKEEMPFKQMPVLEIDGKKICQGPAIARYLAREFGLMGKDNLEGLRIEEINEAFADLFKEFIKVYYEKDEEKKGELMKALSGDILPKFRKFFEMRLSENGGGWMVGDKLSLADLLVYNTYEMAKRFLEKAKLPDPIEGSTLDGVCKKVMGEERIKTWIEKRPVTEN